MRPGIIRECADIVDLLTVIFWTTAVGKRSSGMSLLSGLGEAIGNR